MTIRTVLNQTTRSNKRSVTCSRIEVADIGSGVGVHQGENHVNLLSYDGGADTVWFHPGYEHIHFSTTQGGTTAP